MEPPTGPETHKITAGDQISYHAYLLRLWKEQRGGQPVWRASLENAHTGERIGFADLTQLFAFLQTQASSQPGAGSAGIERNTPMEAAKTNPSPYLLAGGSAELERLQLQARVWEPEAEAMLDRIGIQPGWRCADLGCGAMGILGPLSRRVGPQGHVLGVDIDPKLLAAAREFIHEPHLENVELLELDAYGTQLPRESLDFTHVRFVFGPAGRDHVLLNEMLALTRPGGVLAIQEIDSVSWNCYPANAGWATLKSAIAGAFARAGGDLNAGQRTFGMLRQAGLEDVQIRAAIVALPDQHLYKRALVQVATSLRRRILDGGPLSEPELDAAVAECERVAADPQTIVISMVVTQVWGRKPSG